MMKLAQTNASGPSTGITGMRKGRFASGTCARKAAMDSGAPAYISTVAVVIRLTKLCQLGKGSRKKSPARNDTISENQGTPRLSVQVKIGGKYLFRPRP